MWALAILAGTVVSAFVLVLLKKFVRRGAVAEASAEAAEAGSVVGQRSPVAA
jgi:PTS system fructose-specific IIC component